MSAKSRAEIVELQFHQRLKSKNFPVPVSSVSPQDAWLSRHRFIDLFESQIMSRIVDIEARALRQTQDSFYTIGSSGHEGNVSLGEAFKTSDMAFLHYRSGALYIQRQKQIPGSTPLHEIMLSVVASADEPIAGGRHKVWGSLAHLVPPQTSTIASHLPKAVGAALSIDWGGSTIKKVMKSDSVVLCNFGDASANHSTATGAINHACWWAYKGNSMPIVFVCEDNGIGISVETPSGWIQQSYGNRPAMKYIQANSLNLAESVAAAEAAVHIARTYRKPVFLHLKTVRLLGHAGSDVETLYRDVADIEKTEGSDPLLHSAATVIKNGWLSSEEVLNLYGQIKTRVKSIGHEATLRPKLVDSKKVAESIVPKTTWPRCAQGEWNRDEVFGALRLKQMKKPQHMAKLLNWALTDILAEHSETVIMGEDVARKGGVYAVTTGLSETFGGQRVFDTLLDEQSILGTAIGMSQNGFVPIPEIQFLAYLHNAEDQIRGEAATQSFFSQGQFTNPMVIRIAGLAYQKGFGGHFHNDNSLAVLRDVPGLIVACPSNGQDAALMLRECVRLAKEEGRVSIFVEPIALYMTKDLVDEGDNSWTFDYPSPEEKANLGEFSQISDGKDGLIITYGNGVYLSSQAQQDLQKQGINISIIDLKWLAPVDYKKLAESASAFQNILIVDECRSTGSQSEQIYAEISQRTSRKLNMSRLCAEDCFIPLGAGSTCVLPSRVTIVQEMSRLVRQKSSKPAKKIKKKVGAGK
ncbi:thiamine pyrophosphate-dependent enzyme [Oligoflexaceae bacterium]|nr:thiamine pyrophosphate-dependent enzyme [Oligoflexaceae bacterium]